MSSKKGFFRTLLRKFFGDFIDEVWAERRQEEVLRDNLEQMLQNLDRQRQITGLAMAQTDEARGSLATAVEEHDALEQQATKLLQKGDRASAERIVQLKLVKKGEIENLRLRFEELKSQAREAVADFQETERQVKARRRELPRLEADARLVRAQQEMQRLTSSFSLEAPSNAFDEAARTIRLQQHQLRNTALLAQDPYREIDQQIRKQLEVGAVEEEMQRLEGRMTKELPPAGEVTAITLSANEDIPDAVDAARRTLDDKDYLGLGK